MINAKDCGFCEVFVERGVEGDCGVVVASEWLFDDQTSPFGETAIGDAGGNGGEERRRNSEVEDRMLGAPRLTSEFSKGRRVGVVASDVGHFGSETVERRLIPFLAGLSNRVSAVIAQIVVGPSLTGDPNDWNTQTASAFESVNGREQFLLGEISGGTKHDEEV